MKFTNGLTATGKIVQATPQDFFDWLNSIFRFDLDVCALPENAKCKHFYTPEDDGLRQPWGGAYGATHLTEKTSSTGSEKHRKSIPSHIVGSLSCCFQQGQIPVGFRSMSTTKRFCGSWTGD